MCATLCIRFYTGKRIFALPKAKQLANDKTGKKYKPPGCQSGTSTLVP